MSYKKTISLDKVEGYVARGFKFITTNSFLNIAKYSYLVSDRGKLVGALYR